MVTCAIMLSGMEAFACTGLLVGKKASVDGSVMISYAADSHTLYGELYRWPAATWPKGAMLDIIEWDTHKPLGQIPQVEQTYSVVGNMNEHQVAITESTFGGRPELVDTTGIMDYGSLIYVTLQRSKTAREAIRIIAECYADPTKAKNELGWVAEYGIEEMCADSWNWQKNNPDGYHTVK